MTKKTLRAADPHAWVKAEKIKTTADVELPELLLDEVIGQDDAVEVARKAAKQGRNLLLLGDPGTGKSMIAKAMAQIMPERRLDDVMIYANPKDENRPAVKTFKGGTGREQFREVTRKARIRGVFFTVFEWMLAIGLVAGGAFAYWYYAGVNGLIALIMSVLVAIFFLFVTRQTKSAAAKAIPNLLIERPDHTVPAPFVDATGSHAGALLGDIRHDPFQSGGLQTPVHQRVEPGMIHRAHKGLLFVDEINVLRLDSQQALLTAMQDGQYAITGQSDKSAGAMSRTDPVPCKFILVAAGNMDVIAPTDARYTGLHPALRSRIRGYGYEVYVRSVMEDSDENRRKLVRFVAQEVRRDGEIPHFEAAAVAEVIREAQRRSGHTGKLTLRLRELGGLVRTAGDLARYEGREVTTVDDVLQAKHMSMSLEYQVTRRGIEVSTSKEAFASDEATVGRAAGCAFIGTGETGEPAGVVVPVEADALHAVDKSRGGLFLGGGLEKAAGVTNSLAATLKRMEGANASGMDVHVNAVLKERGADLEAMAAPAAVACISAVERLPVRGDTVVIGGLSITGKLRSVDGITQMIEGAADLGYKRAIVPTANQGDVLLEHRYRDAVEVVFVDDLEAAIKESFAGSTQKVAALQKRVRTGVRAK